MNDYAVITDLNSLPRTPPNINLIRVHMHPSVVNLSTILLPASFVVALHGQ